MPFRASRCLDNLTEPRNSVTVSGSSLQSFSCSSARLEKLRRQSPLPESRTDTRCVLGICNDNSDLIKRIGCTTLCYGSSYPSALLVVVLSVGAASEKRLTVSTPTRKARRLVLIRPVTSPETSVPNSPDGRGTVAFYVHKSRQSRNSTFFYAKA